jgi:hypothetical protein
MIYRSSQFCQVDGGHETRMTRSGWVAHWPQRVLLLIFPLTLTEEYCPFAIAPNGGAEAEVLLVPAARLFCFGYGSEREHGHGRQDDRQYSVD